MNQIHHLVIPAVPMLVDGVVDVFGEALSRMVLLGSAIRDDFSPETSDVDVAILIVDPPFADVFPRQDLLRLKRDIAASCNLNVEFSIRQDSEIERWSEFELCWEGQAARGIVLIEAEQPVDQFKLPRDQAKLEVVTHFLCQSDKWLKRASGYRTDDLRLMASWEASRATCRALQAVMLRYEVDPSPKATRWDIRWLFDSAVSVSPSIETTRPRLANLDTRLALQEKIDILLHDGPEPSLRVVGKTLSSAKRIITACKRGINDDVLGIHPMRLA